jgi:AraC-like DNA-binding protein
MSCRWPACALGYYGDWVRELYDYLFSTASTLREGFDTASRYLYLLTASGRLRVESETDRETTYSFSCGGAAEHDLRRSVAEFCTRAQAGTGHPVTPVRIDFGLPDTTFTFRANDLDLPMRAADPVLAGVLRGYAASLSATTLSSWHATFRRQLGEALEGGSPSLEVLAGRLAISPRTLQRRLFEHGTTWRAELDLARQGRAQHASQAGTLTMTRLARQLGYVDSRSLRRARRRWADGSPEPSAG